MKTIHSSNRKLSRIIGLLLLIFIISSCGNTNENGNQQKQIETSMEIEEHDHDAHVNHADAEAILYGCPIHKEMIGVKGDRCPLCNYNEMIPITWSLDGVDTIRVTSLPDYNPPEK